MYQPHFNEDQQLLLRTLIMQTLFVLLSRQERSVSTNIATANAVVPANVVGESDEKHKQYKKQQS